MRRATVCKGRTDLLFRKDERLCAEVAAEAPDGMFSAGAYNKRSALGRNLAIELLEFFDKRGFSRRTAEGRKLISAAKDIFG